LISISQFSTDLAKIWFLGKVIHARSNKNLNSMKKRKMALNKALNHNGSIGTFLAITAMFLIGVQG
jgi:hypothetical protein